MTVKLFVIIFLFISSVNAQRNPLFSSSGSAGKEDTIKVENDNFSISRYVTAIPFLNSLLQYQKKLTSVLTQKMREIRDDFNFKYFVALLLIAFFYGIIHSLGPGHAKLIIGSYTLSHDVKLRDSLIAGAIFAGSHIGMAFFIFFVFKLILKASSSKISTSYSHLMSISGVLVMTLGTVLLVQAFIRNKEQKNKSNPIFKRAALPVLAATAGIMPCPGALLILIFSNIAGILVYGIFAVISLSLGMAITVSAFGSIGVGIRQAAIITTKGKLVDFFTRGLRAFGALIVIMLGLIMVFH